MEEKRRAKRMAVENIRRFRTLLFWESNAAHRSEIFKLAFDLAQELTDFIVLDVCDQLGSAQDHSLPNHAQELDNQLANVEAQLRHALTPESVGNFLSSAAEDIAARIEEKVGSLTEPDHRLTQAEALDVIQSLLRANGILGDKKKALFSPDSRIGGIFTAGLIWTLIAKKFLDLYGEKNTRLRVFPIAVSGEADTGFVPPLSNTDREKQVFVLDDMITSGTTLRIARRTLDRVFPNANLLHYYGTEYARQRQRDWLEAQFSPIVVLGDDFLDAYHQKDWKTMQHLAPKIWELAQKRGMLEELQKRRSLYEKVTATLRTMGILV